MGLADFFSSFTSTVYADSESKEPEDTKQAAAETEEQGESEPEAEAKPEAEEEEEEEPEDIHPVIRDECKETKCAQLAKHFEHCQEKVQGGQGFKGEECVEELMMHCIDDCAGPKLFSKLR